MTPDPGVSAGAAEDQASSIDSGGPGSDAIVYFTLNLNAKASRATDKKMLVRGRVQIHTRGVLILLFFSSAIQQLLHICSLC